MKHRKIKDIMTPHPAMIDPGASLRAAAQKMKELNCGILPVGSESKLEGVITDRDIVTRAIAESKDPFDESVCDYMTTEVYVCDENDTLIHAADLMRKHKVSRLVVFDDQKRVCGILTFGGILRQDRDAKEVQNVVAHATGHREAA